MMHFEDRIVSIKPEKPNSIVEFEDGDVELLHFSYVRDGKCYFLADNISLPEPENSWNKVKKVRDIKYGTVIYEKGNE